MTLWRGMAAMYYLITKGVINKFLCVFHSAIASIQSS